MNTTFLRNMSLSMGALLASSIVFADDDLSSRVSSLEAQMKQVSTTTAIGTFGAKGTSALPPLNDYGVSINVDLLYWHMYEGSTFNFTRQIQGSENVTGTVSRSSVNSNLQFDSDEHKVHFDWDFGFKAGVSREISHDNWQLGAEFTYFRTKGRDSRSENPPVNNFPISGQGNMTAFGGGSTVVGAILNTEVKWVTRYYNLDIDLSRSYFFSRYLAIRPSVGLKTSWIDQHAATNRASALTLPISGTTGNTRLNSSIETSSRKNNFWGIGPMASVDTKWFLNSSFSIYGSVEAALLWSEFKVEIDETIQFTPVNASVEPGFLNTRTIVNNLSTNPQRIIPTVGFDFGFAWEFIFNRNKNCLEFKLGYENQYWWRQNYISSGTLNSPDDLGFHGGLLEVKFDF